MTAAGRGVLVTGAARGIGRGIARHFASLGDRVAVVDIDAGAGRMTAEEVSGVFVECDLADVAAARRAVREAWDALGRLHVVVNNAADHGRLVPLLELDDAEWQRVVAANLTGTYAISTQFARLAAEARLEGVIVNILAIQTLLPIVGYGPYIASKGGIEALTRSMAVEFADLRVRVNGAVLGAVYSESTRAALGLRTHGDIEEVPEELDASVSNLVRRMGRPSDVAAVVAFLASEAAAYVNGATLVVDGGRLLKREAADALLPHVARVESAERRAPRK